MNEICYNKNIEFSKEVVYHFTCPSCKLWWSIALQDTDDKVVNREFYCPWCGDKHAYINSRKQDI